SVHEMAERILSQVDFNTALLHGMLSFLLFAGALHLNLTDLAQQKWVIGTLATVGVFTSTLLVGGLSWLCLKAFGFDVSFIYCLLFGSLISPTDPIAVLAILKSAGIAKTLETKIAGESLFNDGVGVVIFLVLFGIVTNPGDVTIGGAALLFVQEAIGGLGYGLLLGYLGYRLLKSVDNYQVEVLLTLALVMGGYTSAMAMHISGPIAIVVAGLFIGNHGRMLAMSDTTRHHLDTFWELLDEVLNALLFVLIGLEILVLNFSPKFVVAGLIAIVVVLLSRLISVAIPVTILRLKRDFSPRVIRILVWGGIRGGISVALALSLPPSPVRDLIVTVTYIIVVFSIVVQGLTIGRLVKEPLSKP
ncbi:MAG: sodium:proton antiporter, partial [Gammaproteobacteria bacterium]|nr:sodium:proton antiporter [Gammaproteobacteria bacterium]